MHARFIPPQHNEPDVQLATVTVQRVQHILNLTSSPTGAGQNEADVHPHSSTSHRTSRLPRTHLHALIEHPSTEQHLALLAPRGYGKSELLNQILQRHNGVLLDLSFPGSLLTQLLRELRYLNPNWSAHIDALAAHGSDLDARTLARELHTLGPLIIAVEQPERATRSNTDFLLALLQHLQPHHRLIIAGRNLDHLHLPCFTANGTLRVLDTTDLAFTPEETQSLAEKRGVTLQEASELQGWPQAVSLATQSGPFRPDDLIRTYLQNLRADIRTHLHELAVLTRWTPGCAAQLQIDLPRDWLTEVRHAGLPLLQVTPTCALPHPLLLRVLDQELQQHPERRAQLHARAAELAERHGQNRDVLTHLLHAGQYDRARSAAERYIPALLNHAEYQQAAELYDAFPAEALTPEHRCLQGIALCQTQRAPQGRLLIHQALATPEHVPFGVQLLAYPDTFSPTHWLDVTGRALSNEQPPAPAHLLRRLQARAMTLLSRTEEAVHAAELAVQEARAHAGPLELAGALVTSGAALRANLQFHEAREVLLESLTLFEQSRAAGHLAVPLLELAKLARDQGNMPHALSLTNEALPLCEALHSRHLAQAYRVRGELQVALGDQGAAQTDLDAALQHARFSQDHAQLLLTHLALIELYLQGQQLQLAEYALSAAESYLERHPALQDRPAFTQRLTFQRGRLHFFRQEHPQATILLERVSEAPMPGRFRARATAYLTELTRQQRPLRPADLERLHDHVTATRVPAHVALRGDHHLQLLFRAAAEHDPAWQELLPAPECSTRRKIRIDIKTIGGFSAHVNGVALPLCGNQLRLFAALAVAGPMTRSELETAVFGRTGRDLRDPLGDVRRKLNALAGQTLKPFVRHADHYRLSDDLEVQLDHQQLRAALQQRDLPALRELSSGYTTFMPMFDQPWADELRCDVDQLLEEAWLQLASDAEERQAWPEATLYYQRVIDTGMHETAYQQCIAAHHQRGDTRAAQALQREYDRLRG